METELEKTIKKIIFLLKSCDFDDKANWFDERLKIITSNGSNSVIVKKNPYRN